MAVNTTVEVVMPAMGDSVSEGSILEWHKQEGDEVSEDETLVEISTDKVDAEVPAPISGTVVKIHVVRGRHRARRRRARRDRAHQRRGPRACRSRARGVRAGRDRDERVHSCRHRHAGDGRVGLRGHDPRVGQAARRRRRAGRDDRRDLDRQGRRRGSRPRVRHAHRGARGHRRHRDGRPGHRAHGRQHQRRRGRPEGARAEGRARGSAAVHRRRQCNSRCSPGRRRARRRSRQGARHRSRGPHLQGRRPLVLRERRGRSRAGRHAAQGRRRDARALHGRVARDPDRDVVPHPHRQRPRRAPQAAQGGRPPRLLHAPDRARDRARGDRAHAGDGDALRRARRQVACARRPPGEPRHRRRRREEGRRPHADGAGDPRRRAADVPAVPRRLQRPDRQGARRTS